jgi:hypothetical protein
MKCSKSKTLLQIEFRIRLQSFKWKIENKNNLRKISLNEQECHIALEMSTSETAHVESERENTPTKQYQDKV